MKTTSRRLFATVLLPGLLLTACGDKKEPASSGSSAVEQAAPAIAGPFTGVLTMKTTMPNGGSSDTKLSIGPKGMRAENRTSMPGLPAGTLSMTVLTLADKPGKVYMINETTNSCMELDVPDMEEEASDDPYLDATVEQLGKERINGFDCNHVRLSWPDREQTVELWVSKDLLDYFAYARMQSSEDRSSERLAKKLKSAGLDGFPVKTVMLPEGVVSELVHAERTTPAASLFEVPANCSKLEVPPVPMGPEGMDKQNLKEMEEWARKMQQQMQQQ